LAKKAAKKQLTCLTISACATFALALTAFGGPEPLPSGKEMKEVAPAPEPECFNWSGFYIGAFGGYKRAVVDTNLDPTGDWNLFPLDQTNIRLHSADNLDADGGEVGGLLGFNFQKGCWVFGIEGDGSYMFLRDSFDSDTFANPIVSDKSIQQAFRTNYLATIGGRLGYAIGNWLPYFTGGAAFGNIDYESRLHNVSSSGAGFYLSGDEQEDTKCWLVRGWRYAVRAQRALERPVSIRVYRSWIGIF
jgi:hypothetical protein